MSAVKDAGIDYLDEGDVLTFDIEDGKKGPSAVNLKKVQFLDFFDGGGSPMGIHYDYKSKRGERAMLKEAKRKERLALRKAKRASTNPVEHVEEEKMHDINKPITLDDLTNPNK